MPSAETWTKLILKFQHYFNYSLFPEFVTKQRTAPHSERGNISSASVEAINSSIQRTDNRQNAGRSEKQLIIIYYPIKYILNYPSIINKRDTCIIDTDKDETNPVKWKINQKL